MVVSRLSEAAVATTIPKCRRLSGMCPVPERFTVLPALVGTERITSSQDTTSLLDPAITHYKRML